MSFLSYQYLVPARANRKRKIFFTHEHDAKRQKLDFRYLTHIEISDIVSVIPNQVLREAIIEVLSSNMFDAGKLQSIKERVMDQFGDI